MTLVVDTAPVVAAANVLDPDHAAAVRVLTSERGEMVIPAPVTAETDYFLWTRVGRGAARAFYADLAAGKFTVACLEPHEYVVTALLNHRYESLNPGLADLSVVVLAHRYNIRRILTFDQRHFRAMEPRQGGAFTLVPFDE